MNLRVLASSAEVARAAADRFVNDARVAIEFQARFCVVLSGGSTPRQTYEALSSETYRPDRLGEGTYFFGDERPVQADHEDTNYRMAYEALISRIPLPSCRTLRAYKIGD